MQGNDSRYLSAGFTLLEMMLLIAVISSILLLTIGYQQQKAKQLEMDVTVLQVQQILDAALLYYLNNGKWPFAATGTCPHYEATSSPPAGYTSPLTLQSSNYLPSTPINTPWGWPYYITCDDTNGFFELWFYAPTVALASRMAELLPNGFTVIGSGYSVNSKVFIPGQNLNNARSINFSNIYHPGACVPVPVCPTNMTAQIMVVPVSFGGAYYSGNSQLYPINSFTAYAKGPFTITNGAGPSSSSCISGGAQNCYASCTASGCTSTNTTLSAGNYWRVCMQVVTNNGDASVNNTHFANNVSILAIVRCRPNTENSGSTFQVYG